MSDFLNIIGSAFGGGALGFLGAIFKGWQENRDRQSQREHEREMRKLDKEEMELESALLIKRTEAEVAGRLQTLQLEGDIERDIQARKTQSISYENDKATYSEKALSGFSGIMGSIARLLLVIVDVFRGLMRPGITCYLLFIESALAYLLFNMLKTLDYLSGQQAITMLNDIILSVIFLTATAVTWWFGSRPNQNR